MHKYGLALNTVINEGGWQVIKEGGTTAHTTINQKGKLQVNAGGKASDVTPEHGRCTGYQHSCNRHRHKPPGSILRCGG
ncbi:antigen 43 [Escherichia coli]|uniref:Antigen 43 n=1 Tax=Escherichia coli TaxID=562 RepID=A0A376CRA2_ECOLX|nr:antigen 43 [Escherichia coli]